MFGSHLLPNQFLSFGFFCQSSLSVRFVVDFGHSSEVAARAIVRNRLSKCSLSWATPLSTLAVHSCHDFSRWKSQRSTSASNYCKQHSEVKITTGTGVGASGMYITCALPLQYTCICTHSIFYIVYCMYRVYIPVCMCIQYTPVLFCLYVYVPWKTISRAWISSSAKSTIKRDGLRVSLFHSLKTINTSVMHWVFSYCMTNDPTTWKQTFVLTQRKYNGRSYFVVL